MKSCNTSAIVIMVIKFGFNICLFFMVIQQFNISPCVDGLPFNPPASSIGQPKTNNLYNTITSNYNSNGHTNNQTNNILGIKPTTGFTYFMKKSSIFPKEFYTRRIRANEIVHSPAKHRNVSYNEWYYAMDPC